MRIHKMRFDNVRGHNTTHVKNRHLHNTDIERLNGSKIDEKRLKYLIHRGLFFGILSLITDHELDIHRIMFRHWNGNMGDLIRKIEFGGREDVTRNEIESWYEARREDEENFENHLLSNFFPDRDDATWKSSTKSAGSMPENGMQPRKQPRIQGTQQNSASMNIIICYPKPG